MVLKELQSRAEILLGNEEAVSQAVTARLLHKDPDGELSWPFFAVGPGQEAGVPESKESPHEDREMAAEETGFRV